jgi:hypothetical protein
MLLVGAYLAMSGRPPNCFNVQDPSFHFTLCKVTHGTNHTVFIGPRLLGMLNRTLIRSRIPRISNAQMYSTSTPQDSSVVWVGYKYDGDVLKLDPNGYSYPAMIKEWLLKAALVQPGGRMISLQPHGVVYIPQTKVYVNMWTLPEEVTNFTGCDLRFEKKLDGKPAGTFKLQ